MVMAARLPHHKLAKQSCYSCTGSVLRLSAMSEKLTMDDVRSVIEKQSVRKSATIVEFALKPISDKTLGYLGVHEHLSVTVRDDESSVIVLGFFVKSMVASPTSFHELMFHEESTFLGHVVPRLLQDYRSERWAAHCYLARGNLIVSEDLGAAGFRCPGRALEVRELRSAMACVARFHATCLLLEARAGKPLSDLYPGVFREKVFRSDNESARLWLLTGIQVAETVARDMGLDHRAVSTGYELMTRRIKPTLQIQSNSNHNVLCHCDLWVNNLMFSADGDRCRLVDFQMAVYTSYAVDVAQMIYLHARVAARRELEAELLGVYHSALQDDLRRHGYAGEPISLGQVLRDVEEKRICGLVSAVQMLPVALWPDEVAKEYVRPERCCHYRNVSRKELVLRGMSLDAAYRERMREVVRDLVEYVQRLNDVVVVDE